MKITRSLLSRQNPVNIERTQHIGHYGVTFTVMRFTVVPENRNALANLCVREAKTRARQVRDQIGRLYEKMLASAGTVETIQNGYVMGGGLVVSMIMTVVYMAFAIFLMVQVWKLTDALMQGRGGLGISALDGAASKLRG